MTLHLICRHAAHEQLIRAYISWSFSPYPPDVVNEPHWGQVPLRLLFSRVLAPESSLRMQLPNLFTLGIRMASLLRKAPPCSSSLRFAASFARLTCIAGKREARLGGMGTSHFPTHFQKSLIAVCLRFRYFCFFWYVKAGEL